MYGYYGFISYRRGQRTDRWHSEVRKHVQDLLQLEVGKSDFEPGDDSVELFQDLSEIRGGQDWWERIRLGLAQSPILIAFCSRAYFESEFCVAEMKAFLQRERDLMLPHGTLVKCFAVRRPSTFAEFSNTRIALEDGAPIRLHFEDISSYFSSHPTFEQTPSGAKFFNEVLPPLAERVADMIFDRPDFDASFPRPSFPERTRAAQPAPAPRAAPLVPFPNMAA